MKKPFVALLLLVGAAAMVANMAYAQAENLTDPGNKLVNAKMMQDLMKSRAERLHTSAGPDPDTVWFGHSYSDHWSATSNYWNLYTGVNRPGIADPNNAIWDWDHSTGLVESRHRRFPRGLVADAARVLDRRWPHASRRQPSLVGDRHR
ncbi:MAG: hypothetical protein IPJ04_09385 [Candidatus Eisenbacteria bacterium]|nr:hypothetical protein [Candidatus Eisenbacteria bacterium]